jgi:hypothetical protein
MQSERVKVFVGSTKETFEVPYDLLAQYSTAFKKLLNPLNDSGDEIPLPDVTKSTFEDFFIWLHAFKPTLIHTESHDSEHINGALHLAVFAQRYQIYHLRNQASDVVLTALRKGHWNITPDMISAVYKIAPAGSALRQLSFLAFTKAEGRKDSPDWRAAFLECPDLGWDSFQYQSGSELYSEGIESGGACRFHDHSDILGWQLQDVPDCPYPHGAPHLIPGEVVVSTSVPVPPVRDVVVEDAVSPSKSKPVHPPMPSVAEDAEPEAVELQPTAPSVVESSIEPASEGGCWASETTETEPVEPDTGKFQPQEETLVEETPVETWVSKTKDAEPVEVENLVAEEERSHTLVGNARMALGEDTSVTSKVTLKRISVVDEAPVEKKEPNVEEVAVEEGDSMQDVSASLGALAMERSNSQLTNVKGKKGRNKKGRKQSVGQPQN